MIIIPEKRFRECDMPELKLGLAGYFTLRAIRRSGLITREHTFQVGQRSVGPFHNLITNLGLDRIATLSGNEAVYARCHVGTGTAAPDVSDTQLATFLANVISASPGSTSGNSGSPDYYAWKAFTWTSAVGALGNENLTEVGISGQNTNGLLFSRELIRDGGGSPVSFPISSDESLQVTYELRMYAPQADVEATVSISASSHNTVTRAINVNSGTNGGWQVLDAGVNFALLNVTSTYHTAFSGGLVAITGSAPSGSLGNPTTVADASYTNGNYYRDSSQTFGPAAANGSIQTVKRSWNCCAFQTQYDPPIAKTNTFTLVLNQRVSWARR